MTIGAVIGIAYYSTLFFTYPITSSPYDDWDMRSRFSSLATALGNGGDVTSIAQLTAYRLQALEGKIDQCPDANLTSSMFGGDAAATAKKSAKIGVESAISFLQAVLKHNSRAAKIMGLLTDKQYYSVGETVLVTILYASNFGNTHLRVIVNIIDQRGNTVYDSHPVNEDKEVWLAPGQSGTSSFQWRTTVASTETYTLKANLRNWDDWNTIYDHLWEDQPDPTFQVH